MTENGDKYVRVYYKCRQSDILGIAGLSLVLDSQKEEKRLP